MTTDQSYPGLDRHPKEFPWRLAAPSWVWPGTIYENYQRLAPIFSEMGLCLFESEACRQYTREDLPFALAEGTMRYHVHMPLDLPWDKGVIEVREIIDTLIDKTRFMEPWAYVVHAPPESKLLDELAFMFIDKGIKPDKVLLENTHEFNPLDYWCDIRYLGFNLCLDLGHLLSFDQRRLLEVPRVFSRVKMAHLNVAGPGGRHRPLTELDMDGQIILRTIVDNMDPSTVLMVELFDPDELFASINELYRLTVTRG